MSTLSERLRDNSGSHINGLYDREAADELDRLTEEAADRYKSWCEMHSSFERGRDEIERLTARVAELESDLRSCRGTVKTELNHYERLAVVHGKTPLAHSYETEAQRLSDLLDKIDALESKHE